MHVFGYIFFVCALFAMVMNLEVNFDGDTKAAYSIKKANDFAVHDAALPLDYSSVSEGNLWFDKTKGKQNYIDSLSYSLNATWNGSEFVPNNGSFFQDTIKLDYLNFVDTSNPLCPSFPCTFNVPISNKVITLSGPSVIAILETKSPREFLGQSVPIRKLSIYEERLNY